MSRFQKLILGGLAFILLLALVGMGVIFQLDIIKVIYPSTEMSIAMPTSNIETPTSFASPTPFASPTERSTSTTRIKLPTWTPVPSNTPVPSLGIATLMSNQEPIPGLVGIWQDPETTDTFVITWHNGKYVVLFVTWKGKYYTIISQNWTGSFLTWSYYDTDLNLTVTYKTTSISGDRLYADWSYNNGSHGSETLSRVR
jgi:hypothetical protein